MSLEHSLTSVCVGWCSGHNFVDLCHQTRLNILWERWKMGENDVPRQWDFVRVPDCKLAPTEPMIYIDSQSAEQPVA